MPHAEPFSPSRIQRAPLFTPSQSVGDHFPFLDGERERKSVMASPSASTTMEHQRFEDGSEDEWPEEKRYCGGSLLQGVYIHCTVCTKCVLSLSFVPILY